MLSVTIFFIRKELSSFTNLEYRICLENDELVNFPRCFSHEMYKCVSFITPTGIHKSHLD